MLQVTDLSVCIGNHFLIKDICFQVNKGDIYGLVGANGAGKTTLMKALLGLIEIKSGIIKIDNTIFNNHSLLINIGTLIERAPLYNHLSAYDNLKISTIQLALNKSRIDEVLQIIGLNNDAHKIVNNFSLGMKQRLGIGLAIINNPKLLLLDEPTNGLDPEGIMQTRELLLSINKNLGSTIFMASHLLGEVEKMASHIGFMKSGSMVFNGSLKSFKETDSLEISYKKYA